MVCFARAVVSALLPDCPVYCYFYSASVVLFFDEYIHTYIHTYMRERLRAVFTTRRYTNPRLPLPLPYLLDLDYQCGVSRRRTVTADWCRRRLKQLMVVVSAVSLSRSFHCGIFPGVFPNTVASLSLYITLFTLPYFSV